MQNDICPVCLLHSRPFCSWGSSFPIYAGFFGFFFFKLWDCLIIFIFYCKTFLCSSHFSAAISISFAPSSSQFLLEVNKGDRKSDRGGCRLEMGGGHVKLSRGERGNWAFGEITSKVKPDWLVWTYAMEGIIQLIYTARERHPDNSFSLCRAVGGGRFEPD